MSITNYKVAFKRATQQAQYEGETYGLVEFSGIVEEGGDAFAEASEALSKARAMAVASVGKAPKAEPDQIGTKAEEKSKPASAKGGKATAKKAEEKPTEKEPEAAEEKTEEPAKEAEEITDAELQTEASKAAKRVGADKVKALMKDDEFSIARLGELAQEKRAAFIDRLGELKSDD